MTLDSISKQDNSINNTGTFNFSPINTKKMAKNEYYNKEYLSLKAAQKKAKAAQYVLSHYV